MKKKRIDLYFNVSLNGKKICRFVRHRHIAEVKDFKAEILFLSEVVCAAITATLTTYLHNSCAGRLTVTSSFGDTTTVLFNVLDIIPSDERDIRIWVESHRQETVRNTEKMLFKALLEEENPNDRRSN